METLFALLVLCFVKGVFGSLLDSLKKGQWCGVELWCFLVCMDKLLYKQLSYWWLETPWRSYKILLSQALHLRKSQHKSHTGSIFKWLWWCIYPHSSGLLHWKWGNRILRLPWCQWSSPAEWWRHQMETFSALLAFVRGIHRPPVDSPHKGQWRGALMFSLVCPWINSWANNRDAVNLRGHRAHYDVTVMEYG